MKVVYLILIISLLNSCTRTDTSESTNEDLNNIRLVERSEPCTYKVINDSVVYKPFNIYLYKSDTLSLKKIFKLKPKITTVTEKGTYDDNEYTSYIFETTGSKIVFLKNSEGYVFVESAVINSDDVYLYNEITLGMDKNDVCQKLSIKSTICDTIHAIGQDQTIDIRFIFKMNRLKNVELNTYVD